MEQSVKDDHLIRFLALDSTVQGLKRKDHVLRLARKDCLEDTWFILALERHLRLKF